jgi:LacI family transcriptional regulator
MAPTLKDIADRANVSRTAVSFALRGVGRLEDSTRTRILRIAKELGYRPNLLVRGIQTGKTQTIGVKLSPQTEFFGMILSGIQDELIRSDYVALVLGNHEGITDIDHVHHMIDRRVEGVIMIPSCDAESDEYLKAILDRDIPVVTVDAITKHTMNLDFVGTDDLVGGRLAAEYLLSLGHRRMAVVEHKKLGLQILQRSYSFQARVMEYGDADCKCFMVDDSSDAHSIASRVLLDPDRPTAIFATMDRMCPAIYHAALELGLRIPEDLSIIGYASLEWGSYMHPKLTTIRQRPVQMGREAVRALMRRIEEKKTENGAVKILISPELVVRDSTAGPRD